MSGRPVDRVLEVGFKPGLAVAELAGLAPNSVRSG
jgi:hypothetical protein